MVLPQGVLRAALRGPVLVELKNGDSYSGTLAGIDHLMNLRLEDAVSTARSECRFEKLTECMIRGQFVKFIRFPDEILERCVMQEAAAANLSTAGSGGGSGKGRKERGRGKGGKGGRQSEGAGGGPRQISVPSSLVGMIIGRGGETIRRLSVESGAQIEVARDQAEAWPAPQERHIYLRGSPECVERAYGMIAAFVREKAASRDRPRPAQEAQLSSQPPPRQLGDFLAQRPPPHL